MTIAEFDHLDREEKRRVLYHCCGSEAWVNKMLEEPPFEDLVNLLDAAEEHWYQCSPEQWKDAFLRHPRIGDLAEAKKQFGGQPGEQAGIDEEDTETLQQLAAANKAYEQKFGFVYIAFASGKTAQELFDMLQQRMTNQPGDELSAAADEQLKITRHRLEKLFL